MPERPGRDEAAAYYFTYIDLAPQGGIVALLQAQLDETHALLSTISDAQSLHRYAPDKWSIRQTVSHLSDSERVFLFRAFWFARGFDSALPSFDEKISATAANADRLPWARHVEEFRSVRWSALAFFQNLTAEEWARTGVASGNTFSVRALAYLIAGHTTHHAAILQSKYL